MYRSQCFNETNDEREKNHHCGETLGRLVFCVCVLVKRRRRRVIIIPRSGNKWKPPRSKSGGLWRKCGSCVWERSASLQRSDGFIRDRGGGGGRTTVEHFFFFFFYSLAVEKERNDFKFKTLKSFKCTFRKTFLKN